MPVRLPVYVLYALSGFVSLGYQVAWFRIFIDRFGSTNLTFVLVVTMFIGGLGAGALASRRVTGLLGRRGERHPLRVYGLVELLIAATCLLTLATGQLPADLWGSFPYAPDGGVQQPVLLEQLGRTGLAAACVLLPCVLMGVTFPLLCRVFHEDVRFPAALYAWNTLGACAAVLACEYLLLPWLGHDRTFGLMVAVNAGIGAFFLVTGARLPLDKAVRAALPPAPPPATTSAASGPGAALAPGLALALAVVSGLVTGAVEGDVFKRLQFLGCAYGSAMSFVSFWAILGIFGASLTVRLRPRLGLGAVRVAWIVALVAYIGAWSAAYPLFDLLHAPDVARQAEALALRGAPPDELVLHPFQYGARTLLVYTGVFTFPAFYLLSLLLPWVCNDQQRAGRHLGVLYGVNTIAFCAGVIGFTWIAPSVNVFYSTKLLLALLAIGAIYLFLQVGRRLTVAGAVAPVLALGAACLLVPAGFDRGYFPAGHPATVHPVRALRSNGANTTYVVEAPEGAQLYFENYPMSGTGPGAQRYMRLMAHAPLLLQARPTSALVICFGVGNTASAIATHETIERLDVVDLNDQVFATASEFVATNGNVHRDPRVTLIHDDGRHFLDLTDRRYDLITSEPPPPMREGVYRLYSREYYAAVRSRLTPGGMMTQWIPMWQMPREAVETAIATFLAEFPHALLFVGQGDEFILLGAAQPIDLARLERRWGASDRVLDDLRRIGLDAPAGFYLSVLALDGGLRAAFGDGPILSDQHNDFAHMAIDPFRPSTIPYDPDAVRRGLPLTDLACGPEVAETLASPGWLAFITQRSSVSLGGAVVGER